MRSRISIFVQKTLRWTIPLLVVFVLVYALSESRETEIIIIDFTENEEAIVQDLYERGYLANIFAYGVAVLAVQFGFEVEPGAYALRKNMGPFSFLAAIASPEYVYVHIYPGLRKEEVAARFADALAWNEEQTRQFAESRPMCFLTGGEGYLFPGTYLVSKHERPENIRKKMQERLQTSLTDLVSEETAAVLNMHQVLTIASLIQREAAGRGDMRLISGVIWNRLFQEMPLQIDATLQYVKADTSPWWPPVRAEDKYLDSPYNTYQYVGLPPGPIANPSPEAIQAALHPLDTTCLFYIHDNSRAIHCASTYEAHKRNISYYLQ